MAGQKKKTKKDSHPKWWEQHLSKREKEMVRKATVNYIVLNKLQDKTPKPSVELAKKILPNMVLLEPKWGSVTDENLNTGKWKAHEDYRIAIKNFLNSKKDLDD